MAKVKATIEGFEPVGPAVSGPIDDDASLILFGTDEAGRAHASRFPLADLELVERAASLMGFKVLKVTTPEMHATASEIAVGRIFGASGRAFAPFAKTAAYELLCGCEDAYEPSASVEPDDSSLPYADVPQTWAAITAGSLVLASCGDESGAWYPAVIVEAMADGLLSFRWRDWPDDGPFLRLPNALALLPAAV